MSGSLSGGLSCWSGCFGTSDGRGVGRTGSRLDCDELTHSPMHSKAHSSTHARILLSGGCQAAVRLLSGSLSGRIPHLQSRDSDRGVDCQARTLG